MRWSRALLAAVAVAGACSGGADRAGETSEAEPTTKVERSGITPRHLLHLSTTLGLLYARGGRWEGEQILPEEWVELTRTPSPANPDYGLHWWLDAQRPEVLYAIGSQGQVITVAPAQDLVIVQLSTVGGQLPLAQTEAILDAFAAIGAES